METRKIRILAVALWAALLTSCATYSPNSVKERWNESIRNYALIPIYPMVEQVYIGDIRLFTGKTNPYGLSSIYIGHVPDIEDDLKYKERELPINPKTMQPPDPANKSAVWPQPDQPISLPATTEDPDLRLKLAALPNIELASVTEADFGWSGISGLWNWIVGGHAGSRTTLRISVSGVETLEIDIISAYGNTKDHLEYMVSTETDKHGKIVPNAFMNGVCAAAKTLGDPKGKTSKFAVVTRVFYARSIKYVYGETVGAALRAAAGSGTRPNLPPRKDLLSDPQPDEPDGKESEEQSDALSELANSSSPGFVGSFATAQDESQELEKVFERPMAFGVDILTFPISNFGINCKNVDLLVDQRNSKFTALTSRTR